MFTIPPSSEEAMENVALDYRDAVAEDNARHLSGFIEADQEQVRYIAQGLARAGYLVVEVRSKASHLVVKLTPVGPRP